MTMRRKVNLTGATCLALLLAGCSKVPFEELKAAQTAREEAREIALTYAAEEYNAALALYDQARTEIEEQNSRTGITRSYAEAVNLLNQSREGFEGALKAATQKREALKTEAQEKSATAAAAVEETRAEFAKVRRTSRNRQSRERWNAELDGLDATLVDANDYVSSEYFQEAIGYFDTVLQECERIRAEMAGT